MNFANPNLLWFLLVLPPALLAFLWWSARRRQRLLAAFIQARLLPELTAGISPARESIRTALLVASLALAIVALSRPQRGFTLEESKQKGLDIIVGEPTGWPHHCPLPFFWLGRNHADSLLLNPFVVSVNKSVSVAWLRSTIPSRSAETA